MRPVALLLAVLASAALAGCSFGRDSESSHVDKGEYEGGAGVALALSNEGRDPVDVMVNVVGAGGTIHATINETLEPGDAVERWYSLSPSTYSVRFSYVWATSGHTARGDDDQTVSLADCPAVSRLEWTILQTDDSIASRFEGTTCASNDDAQNP